MSENLDEKVVLPEQVGTRFHYEESGDKLIVERVQDIEPILESNKQAANQAAATWGSDLNKVASIPFVIIEKYRNQGIDLMRDPVAMKRFLNDPDNRYFRTKLGKV